jgi:iron complex transport system ATP-binding protein
MDEATRARHIAWLPQTRQVSWALSVENLIALGRLPWHGWRRTRSARDRDICQAAMQMMDVEALAARPVTELSGGEQARVLLAGAVAQDTPVLLADEPAAGLDPAHQMSMMSSAAPARRKGRTVLVSLHDLSLAARWCDRIVVMKEATVAATGSPDEVMTQAMLRDVYGINAEIGHDQCGLWLAPTGLTRQGDTG